MRYAFFNQYGDCTGISECEFEPTADMIFVEVDEDVAVDDIWRDHADGTVYKREAIDPFDDHYDLDTAVALEALPGCAYFVNGMKVSGSIHFNELGPAFIQIKGRYKLTKWIEVQDYAAKRAAAYPTFAEQFDTLYHQGYDGWFAMIEAVKQQHPKPPSSE
jgi:hypothetical protein